MGAFFVRARKLLDSNFGTADGLASEQTNFAGNILYDTIVVCVDSVVAACACANACTLSHANLANDNLTGLYFLAAIDLNAKALTGTVAGIFGGTACFNV